MLPTAVGHKISHWCNRLTLHETALRLSPRILIVEDEALLAMDLEAIVREAGYQVAGPAGSVDAALDLLSSQQVDAAVLDFRLQSKESTPIAFELLRLNIPFCLCTAYQRLLPTNTTLFNGITVLGKPVVPRDLLAELGALTDTSHH